MCWGPYQTFTQLLDDDWRVSEKNPVFADVDQPGIGSLRTPASPLRFPTDPPVAPLPAPLLGTHTDEVLADVLGHVDARRSAVCTTTGWWRRRAVGVTEPVLADAGFTPSATSTIDPDQMALLAATLDADPRALEAGEVPLPWHWACFRPGRAHRRARRRRPSPARARRWRPSPSACGSAAGSARPARSQWANRPSGRAGSSAAEAKDGSSGRFWLVTVEHTITQAGEPCIEEEQDLVLREPSAAADQGAAADDAPVADWVEARTADPALLFRYSALTFNAHRIHYDEPYATAVEGYPDLVVQGPLTATLLCELARARSGRPIRGLRFRARVPLFANRNFWLTGDRTDTGADLAAVRGDGQTAMTLTATLR